MARRRPQSFKAWALGLVGSLIAVVILYYARVAIIEDYGQRQLAHTQATMQKIQAQHAQRQPQAQAPAPAPQPQMDAYDLQVMEAAAESKRAHDAAWARFYKPMPGCDNWQSDTHMVECQNHKLRAKSEFEQKWAAGEFDKAGG